MNEGSNADRLEACSILVVDDDALVRMGIVDMLEDLGHRVVEAGSGSQALDLLGGQQTFDVMITDQSMPGMTGIELARTARERYPDLPILLATGYVDLPEGDPLKLPRLSKPFDQNQLLAKLAAIVRA